MKKLVCLFLTLALILSLAPAALAANWEANHSAEALHELGLFNGVGVDANGEPIFALDRNLTRNEAVTMLVRLLGKEDEAKAGEWETPFTDVAAWAEPYVGYAYANGLTSGTSATTYSGDNAITASQYLTFVLRALGYDSSTDFRWDAAWELSDEIGLTDGSYNAGTVTFLRGDVTIISKSALATEQKGSSQTLADKLIADGVFTEEMYGTATEEPEILQEHTDFIPPVTFVIEGEKPRSIMHYRTTAGTYTVRPYWNGEPFTEFEVEVEDGAGRVKKNADGTFTVNFPATERLDISLWYDFHENEWFDEDGIRHTNNSRTKRSLTFTPPIPKTGLIIERDDIFYLPGDGFGGNMHEYYVLNIYHNGVRVEDYTVETAPDAPFTATIQADGTLLLMKVRTGRASFTITHQGETATFNLTLNN